MHCQAKKHRLLFKVKCKSWRLKLWKQSMQVKLYPFGFEMKCAKSTKTRLVSLFARSSINVGIFNISFLKKEYIYTL
jgi:hypothetical protein